MVYKSDNYSTTEILRGFYSRRMGRKPGKQSKTRSKLNRDIPKYFFSRFFPVFCGIFIFFQKNPVFLLKNAERAQSQQIF